MADDSVSHKEMKALGRRSASTDQSALTHPTARSRGPFCPGLPLPHPCSPSAVCGPALPFSPVPAKGAPAPPSSSLLPCLWRAGPLGCWVGSWQQDQEGGAWARLQRAERRAPPALVAVTQSSLPLQPPVAAQSFQQEARSISQLSQGHGRGSLLPLAPGAQAAEAQGPWSPGVALHGSRWLHAQPGAALLTLGTSTSQSF